ncbi:MAG: membrane protein insertase YidC [Micropruina sp.]|uniref:membrane protein insertase YidC n=1 Tax=Micropruina sp. TaxID=2737536 RepID=UPI0039E4F8D2
MDLWGDFLGALNTMMQPLYLAVSWIMSSFHALFASFLGNDSGWAWALAIISLTVVIRTLLIPLFVRQIRSSRNMQQLGPQQKALQEKYGHDRERLGQETMKLYKEEGVNPMASCLPLLLQMPIFIALYQVLWNASQGHSIGVLTVEQSESLRNATIFGAKLSGIFWPLTDGFGPTQVLCAILVISMTAVLFVTQLQLMRKNMPPEALTGQFAQQQKIMLYIFPFMYLFMGVNIPVGVLLYWLISNTWTMAQQYILIHNNPAPNTPAYIDWEERMRAKGKDPDELARKRSGKKRRPTPSAAPTDTTKVARQKGGSPTDSSGSDTPSTGSSAKVQRQQVRRQQPQKSSRSARKQGPKPKTNPGQA